MNAHNLLSPAAGDPRTLITLISDPWQTACDMQQWCEARTAAHRVLHAVVSSSKTRDMWFLSHHAQMEGMVMSDLTLWRAVSSGAFEAWRSELPTDAHSHMHVASSSKTLAR